MIYISLLQIHHIIICITRRKGVIVTMDPGISSGDAPHCITSLFLVRIIHCHRRNIPNLIAETTNCPEHAAPELGELSNQRNSMYQIRIIAVSDLLKDISRPSGRFSSCEPFRPQCSRFKPLHQNQRTARVGGAIEFSQKKTGEVTP
jgi:hypothetical protein